MVVFHTLIPGDPYYREEPLLIVEISTPLQEHDFDVGLAEANI